MFRLGLKRIFSTFAVMLFSGTAMAAFPGNRETLEFHAKDSLSGDYFKYSLQFLRTTPLYKVYKLRFPAPVKGKALFGDVSGFYYVPSDLKKDSKPRPGVVCLHILAGDGTLTRIICAHLASKGIPAMMCHFPMFADRLRQGSRYAVLRSPHGCRIFGQALLEAPLDARRTVDIMLSRPEINHRKVNMLGTSLGGLMAATATGNDARIYKAALLLAGGDLHAIVYNSSYETEFIRRALGKASPEDRDFLENVLKKVDPLNNTRELKKLAKNNNLIIANAENDQVIPRECSQKLVKACGMVGKNIIIPGVGHYTAIAGLPAILNSFTRFFADSTVPARQQVKLPEDKEIIRNIFNQFYRLFEFKAPDGKCIFICAKFNVEDKYRTLLDGSMELVRGNNKQVKLLLNLKKSPLGRDMRNFALGYASSPWVLSGKGTLYSGQLEPLPDSSPAKYLIPQVTQLQQFIIGILAMAGGGVLTPLEKWVKIEIQHDGSGQRYINIRAQGLLAKVYLEPVSGAPQKILINSGQFRAEIVFTQWNLAAPASPGIFKPADRKGGKNVKVKQQNLDRMFASLLNFAVLKTRN